MFVVREALKMRLPQVLHQIVRYKRRLPVINKFSPNPGLSYQLEAGTFTPQELEEIDAEDLEELESDFMNVNLSHHQHERELRTKKEREKIYIRKKYFKQKLPNFLTWSDVKQIRHLHNSDPIEWTVDKLSEGFPALPPVINKIISSNWTKESAAKIANRDKSVQRNWELFAEGKLNLPPNLVEHLNKFSKRCTNLQLTREQFKTTHRKAITGGEFSEIITSYNKLKNKTNEDDDNQQEEQLKHNSDFKPKKETYLTGRTYNRRNMTLKELHSNLLKECEEGYELDEQDKHIIKELEEVSHTEHQVIQLKQEDIFVDKFTKTGKVNIQLQKTEKDYSHLSYPQKILIPKEKRKRGCTYKLNDCFYDDGGWFLYRVPGMVG